MLITFEKVCTPDKEFQILVPASVLPQTDPTIINQKISKRKQITVIIKI